jgi:hypothetical protein
MPLPVITDVCRVSVNGTLSSEPSVNVIHVLNSNGATQVADVATDVGVAWLALINTASLFSGDYTAHDLTILPLDGTSMSQTLTPTSWPFNGSSSDLVTPSLVARVITLNTGVGGRSNRGRMFLAGEKSTDVDSPGTQWSGASSGFMQTASDAFLAALNPGASASQLVVASYLLASARPVTSVLARTYFGTQRRRDR